MEQRSARFSFSGEDWQIFDTNGSGNILLSRPELAQKWFDAGFLDESLLGEITFGATSFRYLNSHNKYALAPVGRGKSPKNKVDAIAFSLAIKESRKVSADVSFHDAVYVEQYSRLLPTWTLTPRVEDEMVLGTWLAGGVAVSTESFRWLTTLTGWMPPGDLAEIINAAGFHVPVGHIHLTKPKPKSRTQTQGKPTAADAEDYPDQPQSQLTGLSSERSPFRDGRSLNSSSTNTLSTSSSMPRDTRCLASNSRRQSFYTAFQGAGKLSLWNGLWSSLTGLVIRLIHTVLAARTYTRPVKGFQRFSITLLTLHQP